MSSFHELLRNYRKGSRDPLTGGTITLVRMAELIEKETGLHYSPAAISDWERGKSTIHKDDRILLCGLIKIFLNAGSMHTPQEADALLLEGLYAPLREEEKTAVFSGLNAIELKASSYPSPFDFLKAIWASISEITNILASTTETDPQPRWARGLLTLLGWPVDHLRSENVIWGVFWVLIWWLNWALTFRLMSWPFSGYREVLQAVFLFALGSILVPILIAIPFFSKKTSGWWSRKRVNPLVLWLYTLQGAFVGFQVCYMSLFFVALLVFQLGIYPYLRWLAILLAAFPVVLGYVAAREIPFNMWRAYRRLSLKDGGVFFLFAALGPAWGWFFLVVYPVLLTPGYGLAILLAAVVTLALWGKLHKRRNQYA